MAYIAWLMLPNRIAVFNIKSCNRCAYFVYFKLKKELNYDRFVDPNILGAFGYMNLSLIEYLCYGSTAIINFYTFSAGIDFRIWIWRPQNDVSESDVHRRQSDVHRRQIMTPKVGPRAIRGNTLKAEFQKPNVPHKHISRRVLEPH